MSFDEDLKGTLTHGPWSPTDCECGSQRLMLSCHAPQGEFLSVSAAGAAFTGYPVDDLLQRNLLDLAHPSDRDRLQQALTKLADDTESACEYRLRRQDGTVSLVGFHGVRGAGDSPVIACVTYDNAQTQQLREHLLDSGIVLDQLQVLADIGTWQLDFRRGEMVWSEHMYRMTDTPIGMPVSMSYLVSLIRPDHREAFRSGWQSALSGAAFEDEFPLRSGSSEVWLQFKVDVSFDVHLKPRMAFGIAWNITGRRTNERALRIADSLFDALDGVAITDPDLRILRVNEAFTRITGYASHEIIGCRPDVLDFVAASDPSVRILDEIPQRLRDNPSWHGEWVSRHKCGHRYPAWITVTKVTDPSGRLSNYVVCLSDASDYRAAETRIHQLAFFDELTGLPNRRHMTDRLKEAVTRCVRLGTVGAMLFIDIDNFKALNDTKGHSTGDRVLALVAQRFRECLRESDTIARIGGDEFIVILQDLEGVPGAAADRAEAVAQKLLTAISEPLPLDSEQHYLSASIGISLFHAEQADHEVVLKEADTAMYEAKRAGRNRYRFFLPAMQQALKARLQVETGLRWAMSAGELELYYQPKVDDRRQVIAAEALIRWRHPERGLVAPGEFIPIAEESDMICELGAWVLESACRQMVAWAGDEKAGKLGMAVNVSARQFYARDFVKSVADTLDRHGVDAQRLELELTETLVMRDSAEAVGRMHQLKRLGIRLAMDDFGSGYSSLNYLKRLPFDEVKIDRGFVQGIEAQSCDAVIVSNVIQLCSMLGMSVIAEGVETDAQYRLLTDLGCRRFQGYLFGRPAPAQVIEARLSQPFV